MYKGSPQISDDFITETVRGINHSLIGWYLQTYGMQNALAFIEWLGVPLSTNTPNHFWSQPTSPLLLERNDETQRKLNEILDGYDALEAKLQYKFQDRAYLLQAASHESFTLNNLTPNYNGLDFVGDAIVNYIIIRHLIRQSQFPLDTDDLYHLSALLQSNSNFATISVRNDLYKFVRYTEPEIRDTINSFVAYLRKNRFKPVNDVSFFVILTFFFVAFFFTLEFVFCFSFHFKICFFFFSKFSNLFQFYFLDRNNFVFEVPPIIPSSFEALIAAIFFDSKMDINVVSNVS